MRRSSICIAGRFGSGRGSPFGTGAGYIFASSSSSLSDSTSDQFVIFARSARITTCVIVPRPNDIGSHNTNNSSRNPAS